MRRFVVAAGLIVCAWSSAQAEVYNIFSDSGVPTSPPTTVIVYPNNDGEQADGKATDNPPPEGQSSFKLQQPSYTYGGWGLTFATAQNFSRFNSGELRVWVWSTTGDLNLEIKNATGDVYNRSLSSLGWTTAQYATWVEYRLPMAGVDLSAVVNPFLATALAGPAVFYVDNVRYVDSTADPVFAVSPLNRVDNSPATNVTWTSASADQPWVLADQYLSVTADANVFSWGIQIYTDNTAADANPPFSSPVPTGDPGSNPAGLVDTVDASHRLGIAWSVKVGTTVPTGLAAPDDTSRPDSYQWFYMQDAKTPTIPAENTTAFTNGDPYITAVSNAGIHYTQSATGFGGANTPYKIYFEAPLGTAIRPRTYQTKTLRVEFFTS